MTLTRLHRTDVGPVAENRNSIGALVQATRLDEADRAAIENRARALVEKVRADGAPGIMERFLAEYGLSSKEGVALMCLAEALLRVPDAETVDSLIEDKIAPSRWGAHLGRSSSSLVNASTWALMLTGKVLAEGASDEPGLAVALRGAVKRLGEPVIRTAVARAMRELGRQFVLGRSIREAMNRARTMQARGYGYSYDMLGEAARTAEDARRYLLAYSGAISTLTRQCRPGRRYDNPGISVKLSALEPRYDCARFAGIRAGLVRRIEALGLLAESAHMGFTIDAEESERLDLLLELLDDLRPRGGFGVAVQAYDKRAPAVLEHLHDLAGRWGRRIAVRLVKGAYWDREIKRAQTLGLAEFPVYTRKCHTDIAYLACARMLLDKRDRLYPQFATHNAHTAAAVLHMATAQGVEVSAFEFQRLHGMGEALHEMLRREAGTRCRIYAPVGAHRDLLAYLVRRLLENGANSSFVHQIVDPGVAPADIVRDPVADGLAGPAVNAHIAMPARIYGVERQNSAGLDLDNPRLVKRLLADLARIPAVAPRATPMIAGVAAPKFAAPASQAMEDRPWHMLRDPACPSRVVGAVIEADRHDLARAVAAAHEGGRVWGRLSVAARAGILNRAADLYETHFRTLFAILSREAGKTWPDCLGEVREAVDFLRYYAARSLEIAGAQSISTPALEARGVIACISPWNFPLAIFTGQIAAALAGGNAVIAKPAEQTPLIAARAVRLLHRAGVPDAALQLLPGSGAVIGAGLVSDPGIDGVSFTGSTTTAQGINRAMAGHLAPDAPLIAETGGVNAMIVDSTALPEQAVGDIITSAFQSAGQRCSALRMLYIQRDVADDLMRMLFGAMDELRVGAPADIATDIGPLIDRAAQEKVAAYCRTMQAAGRVLKQLNLRDEDRGEGFFVPPTVIRVDGFAPPSEEIFGPVLHVATFEAGDIDRVIDAVNAAGYGLTFGLHTRIDSRVQQVVERINVGNIYVNRNQIGAVVGSQPFGGEGLSGTGPKAGGPNYLRRLLRPAGRGGDTLADAVRASAEQGNGGGDVIALTRLQTAMDDFTPSRIAAWAAAARPQWLVDMLGANGLVDALAAFGARDLPGPTGESNRLTCHPRGIILCLGPGMAETRRQALLALAGGNAVVIVVPEPPGEFARPAIADGTPLVMFTGRIDAACLSSLDGLAAVAAGPPAPLTPLRRALAARPGPLLPLIDSDGDGDYARYVLERHLCVDTTAAGGNASLLAAAG